MSLRIQKAHRYLCVKAAVGKERFDLEKKTRKSFGTSWSLVLQNLKNQISKEKRFKFKVEKKIKIKLQKAIEKIIFSAYDFGALTALESLGFRGELKNIFKKSDDDFLFVLSNKQIISALEKRSVSASGYIMTSLVKDANRLLIDNIRSGLDLYEVALSLISSLDSSDQAWRAFRVVNTEFQFALNEARFNVFEKSGVKNKKWVTVGDSRVRPTHRKNESQGWIPMNKKFLNGTMKPGEGTDGINCRCILEADLSDPNLVLDAWDGK